MLSSKKNTGLKKYKKYKTVLNSFFLLITRLG